MTGPTVVDSHPIKGSATPTPSELVDVRRTGEPKSTQGGGE
ncbi:hypothetical protein [Mycolicibacterium sp. CR10]|nr:hypothetical protein [Mycolicibacterium sp. CR10]